MLVKEMMKTTVYTIRPDDTCELAAAFMAGKDIGALIVTDQEDGVLGIITERDISRKLVAKGKPTNTYVKDVMVQDIVVVSPEFTIEEAADVMIQNHVKKLPVIENDKMVGIITATDLIRHEEKLVDVLATAFLKKNPLSDEAVEEKPKELQTN